MSERCQFFGAELSVGIFSMNIKKNVHRSIEAFDDHVKYSRFPVGGEARSKTAGGGTFVGSGKELSLHVSNPCSYYFLLCLHKPSA